MPVNSEEHHFAHPALRHYQDAVFVAVGVYGCGVATAVVELAYTRLYADQSGQSLITVVNTTSYTVAPWAEELIKIAPLLLVGCSRRVRRQ